MLGMASNGGALQVVHVIAALLLLLCLGGSIHMSLANNRSVSLSSSFVWGKMHYQTSGVYASSKRAVRIKLERT